MISLSMSHRRDCPFYLPGSGFCMAPTESEGPDYCILGNESEIPLNCPLRKTSIIVHWYKLG